MAATTTPRLALRGITKQFGDHKVLKGVDLTVAPGEFIAIVGRSGCGKSTLLRIISQLDAPTSGTVEIDGQQVKAADTSVKFLFQEPRLLPWKRIWENVALFASDHSRAAALDALRLGIASVALTGSVLLVQGRIDVLTLFLFLMAASRMYDPMQGALQNLAAVIAMRTNVGRMNEILDAPLQTGSEQLTNQGCDIVFDHVGFAYNSGETVLRDVSFTAKQGEVTALVGPSGGGKTTVSRLAARFWDYQKGRITVGGMDVSQIDPEKLMSLYSIVFQDVTLFDNTILENIRLGRKGATDEEVLAAAKLANCEEFAEKLPDKWNTNIGENGCALSGGERQRISIARAFLKDAPIILLDEATASLDVENETAIQEALSRLIKDKTVLIIAHRMRTVSSADKIVVLKDGAVAEQGSPAQLLHKGGIFAHMVQLQTKSQGWSLVKA